MAQVPEEALRLSWFTQNGTARSVATGGAMTSLGGDATANIVNPAGLAFFKTSDFVISPAVQFGKNANNFRGTSNSNKNNTKFELGTSGIVLGGFGYRAKNSFALTVTQRAAFNHPVHYNGLNDYSSFAEALADEFAGSHLTIDQALNSPDISLTTKMAIYTYLVDTATVNGTKQVIARSEVGLLNQEHHSEIKGGITEITFGGAHELNKKFMVGGSFGIPIVKVDRDTYYKESDATGNNNNNFAYMAYREKYKLTGAGLNLRVGMIYRPKEYIRLGLALHSPDIFMLKESFDAGFAADLENLFNPNSGYDSVASTALTGGPLPDLRYTLYGPGKIIISGSYVFREVENIKRQKGFITADIEYTNYKWNLFAADEEETEETKAYYRPFNQAIDASYKGAFNFRIGGELKFRIIMARMGFAYYSSPYKDKALKANKMNLSGGLGYRNKGIFIDLTYAYRVTKDVNFPYRVNYPRANTFSTIKDKSHGVELTVGCKI
jgi:long-subunit fatty acid transport protein